MPVYYQLATFDIKSTRDGGKYAMTGTMRADYSGWGRITECSRPEFVDTVTRISPRWFTSPLPAYLPPPACTLYGTRID